MLTTPVIDHLTLKNTPEEYIQGDHQTKLKKNSIDLNQQILQQSENKSIPRARSQLSLTYQATSPNPISRVGTTTDDSMTFTNPSSSDSQITSTRQSLSLRKSPSGEHTVKGIPTAGTIIPIHEHGDKKPPNIQQNDTSEEFFDALNEFTFRAGKPQNNTNDQLSEHGSYLKDETQDSIILNTYVKRRSNSRTVTTTSIDPHTNITTTQDDNDPVLIQRSRNSVGSKNIDTATLEIERMRNSVLIKREKKRQQQKFIDDDKVLVGNKVGEGHVNYVIAYNMLTGIRVSVSRCNGIMKPLTERDFTCTKKLVFDVSGNELTPSSKYDFKFKDYSPSVFRELRLLFGLDPADYLVSLTSKYILSELNSPGKSGSFFYFSRDYRFIIKTIHRAEHVKLRSILKDYHAHIKNNPNTMISQFYGLHRVKMPLYYGKRRKIYFIIMNNLFPPHRDIHKTFDLKGSTLGRYTAPKPQGQHSIFKDLNWMHEKRTIEFGPRLNKVFLDQLRKDVKLLIKLNIMDYSFLIGIHDLSKGNHDETVRQKKLSVFSPISSNLHDLKNTNPKLLIGLDEMPYAERHKRNGNIFYCNEGGIVSTDQKDLPLNQIYYFGIIDCLTNYSCKKKLETVWRTLGNDRSIVSAVPPQEYGERFLRFLEDSINENTLVKDGFKEK